MSAARGGAACAAAQTWWGEEIEGEIAALSNIESLIFVNA
jgi:hypothetical protein